MSLPHPFSEIYQPLKGRIAAYSIVLPRISIADRSLELIKWIALVLMTGDHINKYLFNGTKEWLFASGRLAMPLFALVLAYNLARTDSMDRGVYHRTALRLLFVGCLSTPPFIALGSVVSGWWPLNIMFTLSATVGMIWLVERGSIRSYILALVLLLVADRAVEFGLPGISLGLAAWMYCRRPSLLALGLGIAAFCGLFYVNGNAWAILALPLALAIAAANLGAPRYRWAFYCYYPLHLVALLLIRIPMSKMGYLFF